MIACDERPDGLDGDVAGQEEEAHGDQLLGSPLRAWRVQAGAGEEPDDDEARGAFDQTVGAKTDEGDRGRGDPDGERDREFDEVPRDPTPGEEPCTPLEAATRLCARRRGDLPGC